MQSPNTAPLPPTNPLDKLTDSEWDETRRIQTNAVTYSAVFESVEEGLAIAVEGSEEHRVLREVRDPLLPEPIVDRWSNPKDKAEDEERSHAMRYVAADKYLAKTEILTPEQRTKQYEMEKAVHSLWKLTVPNPRRSKAWEQEVTQTVTKMDVILREYPDFSVIFLDDLKTLQASAEDTEKIKAAERELATAQSKFQIVEIAERQNPKSDAVGKAQQVVNAAEKKIDDLKDNQRLNKEHLELIKAVTSGEALGNLDEFAGDPKHYEPMIEAGIKQIGNEIRLSNHALDALFGDQDNKEPLHRAYKTKLAYKTNMALRAHLQTIDEQLKGLNERHSSYAGLRRQRDMLFGGILEAEYKKGVIRLQSTDRDSNGNINFRGRRPVFQIEGKGISNRIDGITIYPDKSFVRIEVDDKGKSAVVRRGADGALWRPRDEQTIDPEATVKQGTMKSFGKIFRKEKAARPEKSKLDLRNEYQAAKEKWFRSPGDISRINTMIQTAHTLRGRIENEGANTTSPERKKRIAEEANRLTFWIEYLKHDSKIGEDDGAANFEGLANVQESGEFVQKKGNWFVYPNGALDLVNADHTVKRYAANGVPV